MTEVQLGYKLNDFLFSAGLGENSGKTDEDVLSNAVSLEVVVLTESNIENNEIGKIKLFFDNNTIPKYYKWTKDSDTTGKWEVASSYKPKIENGVISLFKDSNGAVYYYEMNNNVWSKKTKNDYISYVANNKTHTSERAQKSDNQYKSEKLIEITQEHSGSDERFQNTLDQYRKAYLDNINITLGIVGLGILIFYHYK